MSRAPSWAGFALVCLLVSGVTAPALGQEDRGDGPAALFNGQDLSGWKIHGTEKWYVEDVELVC